MKIGIITFHSAHNYGAVLQAYALNKKIINLGYEAEIIDYRPQFITELYSVNPIHKLYKLKSIISLLSIYPIRFKKYKKFQQFINNELVLSDKKFNNYAELNDYSFDYNVYIAGSDQIWNPEINGVMGEYFLDFVNNNMELKISYAASFGKSTLDKRYEEEIASYLKKLDAISVREEDGVKIVNNLINSEPIRVLDPVFLLNAVEWKEQIVIPEIKEKFILVYMMEYNKKVVDIAGKLAKEKKIKILNISNSIKVPKGFEHNLRDLGPKEFLGYIYSAEHIITNSFHGTAFSIIFEKEFFIVPHTKLNSRIENILNLTNLKDQQINLLNEDELHEKFIRKINFEDVRLILKKEINLSIDYLIKKLNSNTI